MDILKGQIRDNLITEENKNDIIYFTYSEQAAKRYGYHTAILKNGQRVNFTCQSKDKSTDDYKWEDKVTFEPVKRVDIVQWQYDNYLSMQSKMENITRKMMEREMDEKYGYRPNGF
jgi:hypothetical protein